MSVSRFNSIALLFSICVLLLSASGIYGNSARATFSVNTTNDTVDAVPGNGICADSNGACSLRAAITEANTTDTADVITLPSGTYTLSISGTEDDLNMSGDLDIRSSLTLQGASSATTLITGGSNRNSFEGTIDLSPSAVAINVVVNNVTISHDTSIFGFGVRLKGNGTKLHLANSTITKHSNGLSIGASSIVTVTDSSFSFNDRAIVNINSSLTVARSNFYNNSASNGSSIAISSQSNAVIRDSAFMDNSGPAIFIEDAQPVVSILNSRFTNNMDGGAIKADGILNIYNSNFEDNTAFSGGAINNSGTANIYNSTFWGNTAKYGGALGNYGKLDVYNSTISGNQTTSDSDAVGGGLYNGQDFGQAVIMTLHNVTVTGNNSPQGGGIYVYNYSSNSVRVENSIIAGNFASLGGDCSDPGSKITSKGYNLIGNTNNCPKFTVTGDKTNVNAGLSTLANNGGVTQTHALQAGSPAINNGNPSTCVGYDQRYYPRVGVCDIGAFEFSAPAATVTPTTAGSTPVPGVTPTATLAPGSVELLTNGGFETLDINAKPVLSPWSLKEGTGEKVKCNKPEKEVAYAGDCAFRFKGNGGENSKLAQNTNIVGVTNTGDSLVFRLYLQASGTVNVAIKVQVIYSNGTEKGKLTPAVGASSDYRLVTGSLALTGDPISKIKVQVGNKGTSGKVYVDNVSLVYLPAGLRAVESIIPLP